MRWCTFWAAVVVVVATTTKAERFVENQTALALFEQASSSYSGPVPIPNMSVGSKNWQVPFGGWWPNGSMPNADQMRFLFFLDSNDYDADLLKLKAVMRSAYPDRNYTRTIYPIKCSDRSGPYCLISGIPVHGTICEAVLRIIHHAELVDVTGKYWGGADYVIDMPSYPPPRPSEAECRESLLPPLQPSWGEWSAWSDGCGAITTQRCGSAWTTTVRTRTCSSTASPCPGHDTETQSIACFFDPCPVQGQWGQWSDCSAITVTCGTADGVVDRRSCDSPAPSGGGSDCQGEGTRPTSCALTACPSDKWGAWSGWNTDCSSLGTCGPPQFIDKVRTRTCQGTCSGDSSETTRELCVLPGCPVDGNWGQWTEWTQSCSSSNVPVTCGPYKAIERRRRECNDPLATGGGKPCEGEATETTERTCVERSPCPVDGNWGQWTEWTQSCSSSNVPVTCGPYKAIERRRRECNDPLATGGGKPCEGEATQTTDRTCVEIAPCPVNGEWGAWGEWSHSCVHVTGCGDGTSVTATRTRRCDNPPPTNGGYGCSGSLSETSERTCPQTPCPGDGNWAQWSAWSFQCPTCGNEAAVPAFRRRTCDDPPPSNGGAHCVGAASENATRACFVPPCPADGSWGAWSSWNYSCSATTTSCGGTSYRVPAVRTRSCNATNHACPGNAEENSFQVCRPLPACPVNGAWSQWSAWSDPPPCDPCDAVLVTTRTRSCDSPVPSGGGKACEGSSLETSSQTCVCTTTTTRPVTTATDPITTATTTTAPDTTTLRTIISVTNGVTTTTTTTGTTPPLTTPARSVVPGLVMYSDGVGYSSDEKSNASRSVDPQDVSFEVFVDTNSVTCVLTWTLFDALLNVSSVALSLNGKTHVVFDSPFQCRGRYCAVYFPYSYDDHCGSRPLYAGCSLAERTHGWVFATSASTSSLRCSRVAHALPSLLTGRSFDLDPITLKTGRLSERNNQTVFYWETVDDDGTVLASERDRWTTRSITKNNATWRASNHAPRLLVPFGQPNHMIGFASSPLWCLRSPTVHPRSTAFVLWVEPRGICLTFGGGDHYLKVASRFERRNVHSFALSSSEK